MAYEPAKSAKLSFGSPALDKIVSRLQATTDERKRYEYVLWLAKKVPPLETEFFIDDIKVKGCISQVYVLGTIHEGRLRWQGFSDALITKGLLGLLIEGLNGLTPQEVTEVNPEFIEKTGLNASLTPSRANGFLNILLFMKAQAENFKRIDEPLSS